MTEEKKISNWEKAGATALDFLASPIKGLVKGIEGVADAGMGVVGFVGGLFDEDFQKTMRKAIEFDATGYLVDEIGFDDVQKASFMNDNKVGQFAREVGEGVGQMLPMIGLSFVPGAGQALGMSYIATSAGGNSMEGALNQGAEYNKALQYGVQSGITEAAVENLGGFTLGGSGLLGKRLAGTAFGRVTSKGVGRAIRGAAEEGLEEIISGYLDPVNLWSTGVDTNIGENFRKAWKDTGRTFALGATVGAVMQGGYNIANNKLNKSRGGKKATRADNSLMYVVESANNYGTNEAQNKKIDKAILQGLMDMSYQMTQMNKSERAEYQKSLGEYKNAFNEDGSIKQDLEIADINGDAISRKLKPISATLKHAPISSNEQVSEGASQAKAHIEKVLGSKANVVITSDSKETNAFYNPGENVFYINNDSASLQGAKKAVERAALKASIHEMGHSAEGTRQYESLRKEIFRIALDENAPEYVKQRVGDMEKRMEGLWKDYADQMKGMSREQRLYLIDTERNSDLLGDLLSDQYFVDKLAERNLPLVKRLISQFQGTIKKSATVDSESIKYLKKLVKRFEKALDNANGGVKISQIGNVDEEREETADSSQESADSKTGDERYSFNNTKNGLANDALIPYDSELKSIIENRGDYIVDSYEKLVEIANTAFDETTKQATAYFGIIDTDTLEKIKTNIPNMPKQQGFELFKRGRLYSIATTLDSVRHIVDEKSLSREEVIEFLDRFADTIIDFDSVAFDYYVDSRNNKIPGLLFKKSFPDGKMYNFDIISNKKRSILLQTLYMESADYVKKKSAKTPLMSKTSAHTPEVRVGRTSNDIISEKTQKDNSFDENNSKNVSDERKSVKRSYEPGKESEFEEKLAEEARQENFNQLMSEQLEEMQSLLKNSNESFEQLLSARYDNVPVTEEFEGSEAISLDKAEKDKLDSINQLMSERLEEVKAFEKERRELEAQLLKRNDNAPVTGEHGENDVASLEGAERDRLESVKQLMNEKLDEFKAFEKQRKELEAQLLRKKENVPVTEEFENNEVASLDSVERERLESFNQQMQEMIENTQSLLNNDASIVDAIIEQEKIYDSIVKMPSVRQIKGTEFAKGEVDLVTQVENYFATYGNKVTNEHLGDVLIDKRGIKDDIAHGIGRKKAAAFVAVPDVIQKGKIVDYQKNWKGRGYDTAVIVAPVSVIENSQENRYFMGVVVIQNKENNRFYVHEVASIKKEGMQPFKTSLAENNSNAGGDTPSIISILQKIVNYNNKSQKSRDFTRKMDIRELLSEVLENYAVMDEDNDSVVFISKDAKDDIISSIWKKVNSTSKFSKKKFASLMADKILENTILADSKIYDADKLLKGFMHRIDLSSVADQIGSDIKRKINARWALKEGQEAISINNIVQALNTKVGVQISAQDLLGAVTEINSLYEFYKKYISEEAGEILKNKMGEEKYKETKKKIAKDLESAFENLQTENELSSKLAYVIDKSQRELERHREYRKEFKHDDKRSRAEGVIAYVVSEIKKIKDHKYSKAQQPRFEEFKAIMQKIGKLMVRGNINLSSTREIMKELGDWYTDKNELLEGVYSDEMAKIPQFFRNIERAEQELSITELRQIGTFLTHVKNIFQNWGKIYRAGKWIDIVDVAQKEYDIICNNLANLSIQQRTLIRNNMYFHTPETVAKNADGYDTNGEFTLLVNDLKQGELMREYEFTQLAKRLDSFLEDKENKAYFKKVMDGKVTVSCGMKVDIRSLTITPVEIPLTVFADLYLTVKAGEKDAIATIEKIGGAIKLDNEGKYTYLHATPKEQILNAYEKLPEPVKNLLDFVSKWYNTEGTQIKYEQDLRKNGVSNLISGEYYPESRLHFEGLNDIERLFGSKGIGNHSFNKERIKGARSTLVFQNCFTKFLNHAYELYTYKHLDLVKDNYNKIIQANVPNGDLYYNSVKMLIEQEGFYHGTFDKMRSIIDYFDQLITDVYGADTQVDVFNRVAGMVRGATATALLGANPKVLLTQASSNIAVLGEIDFRSWLRIWRPDNFIKAVFNKARGVKSDAQKYSKWAESRAYSQGAIKASIIRDKVNKFSNFFMKGVEIADALNVDTQFAALEREVQVKYGLAIGTEENKIKAGEMLDEVGMRTQQNQYASTRPAIVRSKTELAKGFATFKTDSTMFVSNLFSSFTEWATLNKKIKKAQESGDTKLAGELTKQKNAAKRRSIKYTSSLILMCAYMALLGRLFRKLYNKDEDDEATLKDFAMDILMSFNGMMPIISEISSYIFEGYEVDNLFYSSVNNMLSSVKKTLDTFKDLMAGKEVTGQQWASLVRNDVYSVGQMFGVPIKNLHKNTQAIVRIVSQGAGMQTEAFYNGVSDTDLKESYREAKEKGNTSLASKSLDLIYNNHDMDLTDAVLKKELDRLNGLDITKKDDDKSNYSVIAKRVPEIVTIDGEEVELTTKQKNTFKTAYKTAETEAGKMVRVYRYKKLDSASQSYAIRKIYEYQYSKAEESLTGERARLVYFGDIIGMDKLALILGYANSLKGDKDRKEKITAYIKSMGLISQHASLALRFLGYSDKDNDSKVKNFINARSSLTREQKNELLEMLKLD